MHLREPETSFGDTNKQRLGAELHTFCSLLFPSTVEDTMYMTFRFIQWSELAQSVQRLATGWTVRGSNAGGGEIFRTCPDRPWGPPSLLYNGYRVFSRGKERPGRDADPSPPSSAVVMKGQSYTSTSSIGRTACTEPQCLYKGDLYLYLYRIKIIYKACKLTFWRRNYFFNFSTHCI